MDQHATPCARNLMERNGLKGAGLLRQGPLVVVGAPRRSYGYAFVAPRPTRAWVPRLGLGASNEVHLPCAELPLYVDEPTGSDTE